jgi:hypothetical protein
MRAVIDAAKLIWPVTGGWRLFLPSAIDRLWPPLQRLARWFRNVHFRELVRCESSS